MGNKSPKLSLAHGGSEPPSNTSFLGPTPITIQNGFSIASHVLAANFQLVTIGRPISTPKIAPYGGAINTPPTLHILGQTRSSTSTGIQTELAVFPQVTGQTDRRTNRKKCTRKTNVRIAL